MINGTITTKDKEALMAIMFETIKCSHIRKTEMPGRGQLINGAFDVARITFASAIDIYRDMATQYRAQLQAMGLGNDYTRAI